MRRWELLWLLSAMLALTALAIEPLGTYAVFGSDTGEYYRLSAALVASGHIPSGSAYLGWGSAYPDFPGLFLLVGSVVGATGSAVLPSLAISIPVVGALSVLPLYLLFRRLYDHDSVAILGATLATVVMPRLFSLAHPAPLALGDFLVIGGLWMLVEGARDARWYLPLSLVGAALIVTHHLSSYFFLVTGLGGLVLFELIRPTGWSRRFPLRELVFFTGFSVVLLLYWLVYATDFATTVVSFGLGSSVPSTMVVPLAIGAIGVVALVGVAMRARRRARPHGRWRVRLGEGPRALAEVGAVFAIVTVGVVLITFHPLPATQQVATPLALAYFSPVIAVGAIAAGGRRAMGFARRGPLATAFLAAIGGSAVFALATANPVILPARHLEYLLIPLAILAAVQLGRFFGALSGKQQRSGMMAGGVAIVVLISANAAIVYPPPSVFGGFQEGLTVEDSGLWMWVGAAVPSTVVVATDHRLSSMVFGFDGNRATWDSTANLFTGSNRSLAWSDLNHSDAPHVPPNSGWLPVSLVVVDATMFNGVALDPSHLAQPLSATARLWLLQPPFVPVYENGLETAYWIAGPPGSG